SDWSGYLAAERARANVLTAALADRLARVEDTTPAGLARRGLLLRLLADTPVDVAYAPFVERLLARCPAGPNQPELRAALLDWLHLALDGYRHGAPVLGAVAIGRLAAAVGDVAAPEAALVALAGGDLAEAERLERRAAGIWSESWSP